VANFNTDKVAVLLKNVGSGFTRVPGDIETGGDGPQAIVTGKFNNDNHLDLAALHFGSNNVSILLGNGDGSFALAASSPISLPSGIAGNGASLTALDFNGDRKFDLAAATYNAGDGTESHIYVLLGDGQGGFSQTQNFQPGFPPSSIAAADFNDPPDGLPDLAASFFCSGEVAILINPNPPPIITVAIDIKPGSFPNSINRKSDGKIPVAILSSSTFDAPAQVDPNSLTFGHTGNENSLVFCNASPEDVNQDGLLDLVCHFDTQTAAFQPGDTQGILKGKTTSGTPITGTDSVRIVN
jgi:hypothetical protein